MLLNLPCRSDRVLLRSLEAGDVALRWELHGDEAYLAFVGSKLEKWRFEIRHGKEVAAGHTADRVIAAIADPVDGAFVGELTLHREGDVAELTISVHPRRRCNKFASSSARLAFAELSANPDLRRVVGRVAESNADSLVLMKALGMTNSGEDRDPSTKEKRVEFSMYLRGA